MALLIKKDGYAFLIRLDDFNINMKKAPIIANFKRPVYQTFN